MAFGDALRPTDGATVVLNVDTSQTAKLEQAEAQWRESVGTMSREALKLDLAQDRLKKSLATYGAESAQAKRATIALKDAEEQAARSADKLTRETNQLNTAQDRQRRGMSSMTKGVIGLAGAYFGTQGLISATRSALNASSNHVEQMDFARRTFEAAFPVVQNFANNALGLARDQAYEAAAGVGALLKPLGVAPGEAAKLSVQLSKLSVDFASMRNARLEDVLVAIRAGLVGESEPLRRFSVLLSEARVQQVALTQTGKESVDQLTDEEKVRARIAIIFKDGAQAVGNYADTIEGTANQEREAQKNLRNTAILIGDTLQPAYRELLGRVNAYLGSAENQAVIQAKVNRVVETGEQVVRGFAGALQTVDKATRPVVNALGGMENTVKLLLLAFAVGKVLAFASAIRLIGTNSIFARRQMALLAATPVPGAKGVPAFGFNPGALILAGGVAVLLAGLHSGQKDAVSPQQFEQLKEAARNGQLSFADLNAIPAFALNESQRRTLRGLIAIAGSSGAAASPDSRSGMTRGGSAQAQGSAGGEGGGGSGEQTLEDLLLNVARPGNERADLQALRAYWARRIRVLEAKKNLTKKQKEELARLYGELGSVQSQIDALDQEARDRDEERERKREEAERKAAERERRRMDRILDAAEKTARKRGEVFEGVASRMGSRAGMRALALRGVAGTVSALQNGDDKPLTAKQLREELNKLLRDMNSLREFGSNFTDVPAMGQVATQSYAQTQELREISRQQGLLVRGQWHPGAWYAGNELAVAGTGVGY